MKSFERGYLDRLPISLELLRAVGMLREFKGRQELYKRQIPQALETLQQAAVIQSTESSNRIEGVVAPLKRIQALVAGKTTPRDRSEQEIAGYRDVLNTIHANHAEIPFKPGIVLQFHRDLYQYAGGGGQWKGTDNDIVERQANGKTVLRFKPVPAFATPDHMERLHERFDHAWNEGKVEPLLLIAAYVLDFLCIHPFPDGNGRMARLLTLLLLYHAGRSRALHKPGAHRRAVEGELLRHAVSVLGALARRKARSAAVDELFAGDRHGGLQRVGGARRHTHEYARFEDRNGARRDSRLLWRILRERSAGTLSACGDRHDPARPAEGAGCWECGVRRTRSGCTLATVGDG